MRSGLLFRHGIIFLCACFLCACSGENSSGETTSPEQITHGTALKSGTDTDVAYYGLSQDLKRNSDLSQINTETVKTLVPLWTLSLGENHGLQTQPLVIDGVMYVTTHDSTHAIDARTGRQIWKTLSEYSQKTVNCCGFANRGLAFHDGKLYRTNVDNRILAIDPANGAILWEKDVIDPSIGYSMTSAPLIANNVLITGIGGAELARPGSWMVGTRKQGNTCGVLIRSPNPVNRAVKPGPARPGARAVAVPGSSAPMMRNLTWSIGE